MYCNICGNTNASYIASRRQALCSYCAKDTPSKLSFDEFRMAYWPTEDRAQYGDPPRHVEREFYDDYRASYSNIAQYIADTQEVIA